MKLEQLWSGMDAQSYTLWIKITHDPVAEFRGFSIVGRELRVIGFAPFEDEMIDSGGKVIYGKYWKVLPEEVFRVIPELARLRYGEKYAHKPWLFPIELSQSFPRPRDFLQRKVKDTILR